MTQPLSPINQKKLAVQKRRARLAMVDELNRAYQIAHEAYGMTRKEFADRIGMKPSQLSRILSGAQNITLETAEMVARAMEARVDSKIVPLRDLETRNSNRYVRTTTPRSYAVDSEDTAKSPVSKSYSVKQVAW